MMCVGHYEIKPLIYLSIYFHIYLQLFFYSFLKYFFNKMMEGISIMLWLKFHNILGFQALINTP